MDVCCRYSRHWASAVDVQDGTAVTGRSESESGVCNKLKAQLEAVDRIYSTRRAFAAAWRDGTLVTWGDKKYAVTVPVIS